MRGAIPTCVSTAVFKRHLDGDQAMGSGFRDGKKLIGQNPIEKLDPSRRPDDFNLVNQVV